MVLFTSLWSVPLFFRRIVETSHPRNEENFRRRKHQEPKYLTLCKEKESTKQLYMRQLSILKDPTFSTHNNPLIHLSTPSNVSYSWSFSSLVSILLCDNAQLISNRREINLRHIDHVNICIVWMSMFIKDSTQKTPMTMVNP